MNYTTRVVVAGRNEFLLFSFL